MVIFYVSDRHGAVCLSVSCDMCCGALHSLSALWPWIPKAVDVLFFFFFSFFVLFFFLKNFFCNPAVLSFVPPCHRVCCMLVPEGEPAPASPGGCPRFPAASRFAQLLGQQKKNHPNKQTANL